MKAFALLKPTRQAVTNLATSIANAAIPGFKAKSKHIIEALAQHEGLSSEAFLDKLDKEQSKQPDCIKAITKEATFYEIKGKPLLICASISVSVFGYGTEMIQAHQASIGNSLDCTSLTLKDLTPTLASGGRSRIEIESDAEAAENLFAAYAYVMELCRFINSKKATKESLESSGWAIKVIPEVKSANE